MPEEGTSKAQMAVQRLNALLQAQGMALSTESFEKEIEINDCRSDTRYYLCKGTTHEELHALTKATIKVRGKYKPPEDTSQERALHLFVTAETKQSLDAVVNKIQEIIQTDLNRPTVVSNPSKTLTFNHQIFVGMEGCDPQFNLIPKILGPEGSFLKHIENQSNSEVTLRGVGSGTKEGPDNKESPEPLHVMIEGKTRQYVDIAKKLVDDLLSHVRQEYYLYTRTKNSTAYPYYQAYPYAQYYQGYPGYQAYPQMNSYGYPYAYPQEMVSGQEYQVAENSLNSSAPQASSETKPSTTQASTAQPSTQSAPNSQSLQEPANSQDDESAFYAELSQLTKSSNDQTGPKANVSSVG